MTQQIKIYISILLISSVGTYFLTKSYFPRVETRNVEIEKEVLRTDVKTITRIIERPDGTKETVEEKVDKSVKQETSTKESTVFKKNNWKTDVFARVKSLDVSNPLYDIHVSRRILESPAFVGVKVSTDKSIGVSIGIEF